MRKALAILLSVMLVAVTLSFASFSYTYGDFIYEDYEVGVVITSYTGTDEEVIIPSQINGKSVVAIANYAFDGCSTVTAISFPDTLTSIGACAFRDCFSLGDITLPATVTTIDYYAFDGCNGVRFICDKNSVAHSYALIYGINFVLNVTGADAQFEYVKGSSSVTITGYIGSDSVVEVPEKLDGVTVYTIAENAFARSRFITSVIIPSTVEQIGRGAFSCCPNLQRITVESENANYYDIDGVLFDTGGTLLQYPCGRTTTIYSIPTSTSVVGYCAFRGSVGLESVVIPESVTEIGYYAFADCASLMSVTVADSSIITGAGILNNTKWYENQPDGVLYLSSIIIGTKNAKTDTVLREDTVSVAAYALERQNMTSVLLPNVEILGYRAFGDCKYLERAEFGEYLYYIGGYCFENCLALSAVAILSDNTQFCDGAFDNLSGLTITCCADSSACLFATEKGYGTELVSRLTATEVSVSVVSDTYASVLWNNISRAQGYKVYLSDKLFADTQNSFCRITGLKPSTTYSVFVIAYDAYDSKVSAAVSFTTANYTVGDINGIDGVTISDALILFKHIAGIQIINTENLFVADIDASDSITISDALLLFKLVAGMI